MPSVFKKIKKALDNTSISCNTLLNKTTGMSSFDVPNDFAHIWCFIEFVYGLPAIGQTLAHRQISGDGVIWAGCTFMKLLGFSEKHMLLSYLSHLAYTRSIEAHKEQLSVLPDETEGVIIMSNYVKNVNEEIYKFLDLTLGPHEDKKIIYPVPEKREFKENTEMK